jgi:hypothetical protein
MKRITTTEFSKKKGVNLKTLQKQLLRDQNKDKKDRKYPGAIKIGRDWFIPERDA